MYHVVSFVGMIEGTNVGMCESTNHSGLMRKLLVIISSFLSTICFGDATWRARQYLLPPDYVFLFRCWWCGGNTIIFWLLPAR